MKRDDDVGDRRGIGAVRGDERGSVLITGKAPEQFQDRVAGAGIEISRGLIGQQNFWRIDQRASDGHSLHLSTGKLVRQALFETIELNGVETA